MADNRKEQKRWRILYIARGFRAADPSDFGRKTEVNKV